MFKPYRTLTTDSKAILWAWTAIAALVITTAVFGDESPKAEAPAVGLIGDDVVLDTPIYLGRSQKLSTGIEGSRAVNTLTTKGKHVEITTGTVGDDVVLIVRPIISADD